MKYSVCGPMKRVPAFMAVMGRTLALAIALLVCDCLALAQSSESQLASITAALQARDYDKAVQLSRAALQDSPENAQLWTLHAIALASKGDGKDALTAFRRALKITPHNIAALAGAAQLAYQSGDPGAAILLNRLLQLRPEEPTAHAMMAVLDYRKGNCAAAAPHFEKAVELLDSQ